jgi:hypothetical protein
MGWEDAVMLYEGTKIWPHDHSQLVIFSHVWLLAWPEAKKGFKIKPLAQFDDAVPH